MQFNLEGLSERETYSLLTQTIIARPIAWVLSENIPSDSEQKQTFNLAPFSFFNGIASNPALLMISVGTWDVGGRIKDTLQNIRSSQQFTLGIPSFPQYELVQKTAKELPYGVSEVDEYGIATTVWDWLTPIISNCSINFACTYREELTPKGSTQIVVFAEISKIEVSEKAITHDAEGRISIDPLIVDPLLRLGNGHFGQLGSVTRVKI